MINKAEKEWDNIVEKIGKIEAVHANITGLSHNVKDLHTALGKMEKSIGEVDTLEGATIVGTLNMMIAMIKDIQEKALEKR